MTANLEWSPMRSGLISTIDDRVDLMVVGEWMPITILIQNDAGIFEDKTNDYGLANTNGWWNTIAAHDFDKDGDIDFVAGNLGLNSKLRATAEGACKHFYW